MTARTNIPRRRCSTRSTIRDRKGRLEDWNVTILGDILHSRVARSNMHLLGKFGAKITLCGPAMWMPRELEDLAPNVAARRASKKRSTEPTW